METFTEKVAKTLKVTKLYLDNTTIVGNMKMLQKKYMKKLQFDHLMSLIKGKVLKVVSATFLLICFVRLQQRTCETRKNVFLFYLKSSFRSWDNQVLNFQIFKCHNIIKCLSMKQENTFYWITWKPNTAW